MDKSEARWIVDTIQEQREEIERLREIEKLYRAGVASWNPVYKTVLDERDALQREVERLRAALKECADELADQVEGHYAKIKDHPAMKRRYDRDMAPVLVARELLEKKA